MIDAIDGTIPINDTDKYVNQYIFPDSKLPEDITLQLVETTAGFPDYTKIIARGILPRGTTIVQGNSTTPPSYSKVELFPKVKLEKGKYYSLTVMAPYETYQRVSYNGSNYVNVYQTPTGTRLKVRIAKLGQRFPNPTINNNGTNILNQQAYNDGVLLVSSNNMTWTPQQDSDLTFKISKSLFNTNKSYNVVQDTGMGLTNITDIMWEHDEKLDEGTSITNTLAIQGSNNTYSETSVSVSREHKIIPKCDLDSLTITSTLKSNALDNRGTSGSNIVNKSYNTPSISRYTSVYLGEVQNNSVYVSKNIKINGSNIAKTFDIILYADIGGIFNSNKCKIYYTTDEIIGSNSWHEFTLDSNYIYNIERKFTATGVNIGNFFRYKINLYLDLANEASDQRTSIDNIRIFLK